MRTVSGGEATILGARQNAYALKIEIKDAGGSYVAYNNIGGVDWQDSCEIVQDADQRVAQATVEIAREADGNSLSPLINADIDAGRAIRISGSRVAIGSAASYKVLFQGVVDSWDMASDPMTLVARDDSGMLVDRWVEEETIYGTDSGRDIEDVMQDIIDGWADGAFTLYTPTSPGFLITPYKQQKEPVFSALQALADLIGWTVEYRWHDGTSAFRLTFYEPERTPSATDHDFGPDDYYDVSRLAVNRLDIRNAITVRYTDAATDTRSSYTTEDATSIAAYGRRWMEMEEADDSPISSDAEATVMGDAALADLAAPVAEQEIETDLFWPIQLGDFYGFTANDVHYDVDQQFAVTGLRHSFKGGSATTHISTRGAGAVAHTRGWIKREKRGRPLEDAIGGIAIQDFREISRTATSVTYGWKLGPDLAESWIYDFTAAQPYSDDKWPGADNPRLPDTVSDDRTVTYTVTLPDDGYVGYFQVEGRKADHSVGGMERALVFPIGVAGDYIAFAACSITQSDGSVKIFGWTTDRAHSIAYAYNVGAASSISAPTEAETEAQGAATTGGGLVTGFTSDFEITLPADTVGYGEVIKGVLIAYINTDGTGPDGTAQDHDTPVGFQGERFKITDSDQITDGIVIARKINESSRSYGHNIVFSATDWDTVAWTSGTLTLADGTSYSIASGNTGNMGSDAARFIYFDSSISTTVLQVAVTTSPVGENVVYLASAKRSSLGSGGGEVAYFRPGVGAMNVNGDVLAPYSIRSVHLQADSVVAGSIDVDYLRAITADLGNVISGYISNGSNTAAIKLSTSTADPDGIPALPSNNFIDLTATGTSPFIKHNALTLKANGDAEFGGVVTAESFTGSNPVFAGAVTIEGGEGTEKILLQATSGGGLINLRGSDNALAGSLYAFAPGSLSLIAGDELYLGNAEDVYLKNELLSFGASDSAGTGYRMVRVPN